VRGRVSLMGECGPISHTGGWDGGGDSYLTCGPGIPSMLDLYGDEVPGKGID